MNLPLDSVKMEPCYTKVNLLPERLQELQSRFRFPHVDLVVQRTQNYMQEVGAAAGQPWWMRMERGQRKVQPGEAGPGAAQGNGHDSPVLLAEDMLCRSDGFSFLPC